MNNLGEKIIEEIGKQGMFATHDVDGPVERALIYVWSSGAAEQLEAVVAEHVAAIIAAKDAELELQRMQMAGMMTVSMQNTETAIKDRITRDHPYWCQGYEDVCRAIDREMALRQELNALTQAFQKECDHEWEHHDDSFDHEFGTEQVHSWVCEKCGAVRGEEPEGEL